MSEKTNLNQLDNSILLRRDIDDIDLTKAKIIESATDKSLHINETKVSGIKPEDLEFLTTEEIASAIKNDLRTAKSFGELDGKLSKNNLWLDEKNNEIIFTDGFYDIKASKIDTDFRVNRFQRNFGEDFSKYLKVRNDGIDIKGAEKKVQVYFDQEIVKDMKASRKDLKSKIEETRYELASIQTSPKQTRNTTRKETLLAQKSELLRDHKNLTAEIASLEKKGRLGSGIDQIKFQVNRVKSAAGRLGESASLAKKGYKINKLSMDGMQSARKVIGVQQAFKNKISEGVKLPSKFKSLTSVTKPAAAVAFKAYSTLSRIANDPEQRWQDDYNVNA